MLRSLKNLRMLKTFSLKKIQPDFNIASRVTILSGYSMQSDKGPYFKGYFELKYLLISSEFH